MKHKYYIFDSIYNFFFPWVLVRRENFGFSSKLVYIMVFPNTTTKNQNKDTYILGAFKKTSLFSWIYTNVGAFISVIELNKLKDVGAYF